MTGFDDADDFALIGRVFDDLVHIAERRVEGVSLVIVPDLPAPLLMDNVSTVYLFLPAPTADRPTGAIMKQLLESPAVVATHPAFDEQAGYTAFAASRKHGHSVRALLASLSNTILELQHDMDQAARGQASAAASPE